MRTPATASPSLYSTILVVFIGWIVGASELNLRAGETHLGKDYLTHTWFTDNGLPHNVVNRILQDESGFLWLATAGGLTRFDGQEFKEIPLPSEFTQQGYNIRDIALGDHSTLLVVPVKGGVFRLQGDTFSKHPICESLNTSMLAEIFAEPDGTVWAGSYDNTLTRWQNGKSVTFGRADGINRRALGFFFAIDGEGRTWIAAGDFLGYYQDGKLVKYGQTLGEMLQITAAKSGGLWILVNGRLLKLEKGKLESLLPEPPWLAGKSSVHCFLEDNAGVLWLGTTRLGLFRFENGKLTADPASFPGIQSISQDREGNIWVATDGNGIRRLRPKAFRSFGSQAGVPELGGTSVCEDPSGDIWFANRAAGLVRKRGEEFQVFPFKEGKNAIHVSCVCSDQQGNLWVGAPSGLYQMSLQDPTALRRYESPARDPRVLFCTQAGDLWVAFSSGPVGFYSSGVFCPVTDKEGFLGGRVTAIEEGPNGILWLGTSTGDLYRGEGGQFTRFAAQAGLPESPIHALHSDVSGALWIGTLNGLLLKKGGQIRRFTQADGLPNDMIFQIIEDDKNRLWFGGPHGLFNVPKSEFEARAEGLSPRLNAVSYGTEEGLPGISPSTRYFPSTLKDSHGVLWFTTHQRVVALDPEAVVYNRQPPPVKITRVLLDDLPMGSSTEISIPPGRHHVEFHFAVLSFAAPEKVRIRHQLEGIDPGWVETTHARSARYTNLPPGKYRLHVIACNNDGVWNNEGANLAVTVIPAWWQTGWFLLCGLLAFTGLVVWSARYWTQRKLKFRLGRLEQEHALEKERARIARDMHDELGSSVTGISLLVDRLREHSTPAELSTVAEQLADRTRRLAVDLERVVWTVSPKNNSLHHLALFIGRFAQNFLLDPSIECVLRGLENIPPRPLTPDVQHHILAVAKESINNILKHAKATQVVIETRFNDDVFALSIHDNGVGFSPEAQEHSERNGLSNMRSRIAEINGVITIRSERGNGTQITLSVPINPASTHP